MVELIGPWFFGVAMFSVLVIAATFLNKVSEFISQGVSPVTVLEYLLLALPGVLAKTFAMSTLLASLLAFGRLSADSEITAIRASGASIYRIMRPVAILCGLVAVLAFVVNQAVVPKATRRMLVLQSEVARQIDSKAYQSQSVPIHDDKTGTLRGYLVIEDLDIKAKLARGVQVIVYDEKGQPLRILLANELEFTSDSIQSAQNDIQNTGSGWRINGEARIIPFDMSAEMRVTRVWPNEVPMTKMSPEDIAAAKSTNGDPFTIAQLQDRIANALDNPAVSRADLANWQFLLWNKIALPLTAVVFGLLGAPLGIRNARSGSATGFAIAVAIIFCYFVLANTLNVFAMAQRIPAYVASFTPLVIGIVCAVAIMRQREN